MMSESDGSRPRLSARLRLIPIAAVLAPPSTPSVVDRERLDHRRVADGVLAHCARVLDGSQPLSVLRRFSSPAAFAQLRGLYRRLAEEGWHHLRLARSAAYGPDGVEIVATIHTGGAVRAVAMRAHRVARREWRLTSCQLVGGY